MFIVFAMLSHISNSFPLFSKILCFNPISRLNHPGQTDRQTDTHRQAARQTNRQAAGQTVRQTDSKIDGQRYIRGISRPQRLLAIVCADDARYATQFLFCSIADRLIA